MFKTRLNFHITATIAYILYIFAFKYFFAPLHFGFFFYVVALAYLYLFWDSTSDCTTKEEAEKITRQSGSIMRYKSDTGYAIVCSIAILLLLVSITLMLITMVVNQHTFSQVRIGTQITLFILNLIGLIYLDELYYIGDYHLTKRPKKPADTTPKPAVTKPKTAPAAVPRPVIQTKPVAQTKPATPVASARPVAQTKPVTSARPVAPARPAVTAPSSGIAAEVAQFVLDILEEELGVERCELVPQADLMFDLGADDLDVNQIHFKLEEFIWKRYGEHPHFIKRSDTDSYMLKELHSHMDYIETLRASGRLTAEVFTELCHIARTVRDYVDLYTEIVTIIKRYH